ncbi:MAG: 8-amino-7-oxononanoate synthase [Nitriliruptorales bacterium]|nr:8-amino-7-oxononanoate synthase [Nitriliruptorales bacterium]
MSWLSEALAALDESGLRRHLRHRSERAGRRFDGLVNFSSNDYLGLAGDPRIADAAADAATRWGAGAGASRLVTGGTSLHRELERALSDWKGSEDAVVFSSGYLANTGTIAALVGPEDAVFSDELNHASIVDGCRLSRAVVRVFAHRDLSMLGRQLAATPARRRLIVTDGVFSMDGDAADLPALAALAHSYDAMLMVDDAHGCGVVGPGGRGTAAAQDDAAVDVTVGTLSKAFGSAGGYVTGSAELCEWLRNRARGFVFDTALPPPAAGAALEALRISEVEPSRRETAIRHARTLARGLGTAAPAACVVPLIVGDAARAVAASAALAEAGLHVVAIRPPSVPPGTARLRFATTAAHEPADIELAIAAAGDILAPTR